MSAYAQVGGQPNTPAMLIAAVTRLIHSNCKRRRLMPACGRVRQAASTALAGKRPQRFLASTSVLAFLGLDGNSLSGANGLAELASDATLLTSGIAAQSMFATEAGGDGTLLEGVVDSITIM